MDRFTVQGLELSAQNLPRLWRLMLPAIFACLLFFIAEPALANGESQSNAAYVRLKVEPQISIELLNENLHLATIISQGNAEVIVSYEVKGNHDQVALGCAATDLYKAFIPSSQFVVPLDKQAGCKIIAEFANPAGTGGNVAAFNAASNGTLNNLPAYDTSMIAFESAGTGRFTMKVDLRVKYVIDMTRRTPIGNYGGYVKLYAITLQ